MVVEQKNLQGEEAPAEEGHFFKTIQDSAIYHESEEFPGEKETDVAAFLDPRTNMLGVRILCGDGSLDIKEDEEVKICDNSEEYDLIRMMNGIGESSEEIGGQFPLNMNLHYLNGVSFDKGCYIGQELTQRTFHTGVVRRMALPILLISSQKSRNLKIDKQNFVPIQFLDKDFDLDLKGEEIFGSREGESKKPVKLGKVLTNRYNSAVALLDASKMDKLGPDATYHLSDYQVIVWQAPWLGAFAGSDQGEDANEGD